jgi:hypothetical protein
MLLVQVLHLWVPTRPLKQRCQVQVLQALQVTQMCLQARSASTTPTDNSSQVHRSLKALLLSPTVRRPSWSIQVLCLQQPLLKMEVVSRRGLG